MSAGRREAILHVLSSFARDDARFHPRVPVSPQPNGRFDVGKKICLSISAHHPEEWQAAWGIRLMLEALVSFLPTEGDGALGALDYTSAERKRLADQSVVWCCSHCGRASTSFSDPFHTEGQVVVGREEEADACFGDSCDTTKNHYERSSKKSAVPELQTPDDEKPGSTPAIASRCGNDDKSGRAKDGAVTAEFIEGVSSRCPPPPSAAGRRSPLVPQPASLPSAFLTEGGGVTAPCDSPCVTRDPEQLKGHFAFDDPLLWFALVLSGVVVAVLFHKASRIAAAGSSFDGRF